MTILPSDVAAVFDDWAERGRAEGMERGHALAARAGFDLLEVAPGSRYLDVGCGNGYSVRWAAAVAPTVRAVGIDVSAKMIARAAAQSVALTNCEFICGEFPNPAFAASSFDAVFSMEVFYYLPNVELAIGEVAKLLTPGGRFACIVDHYRENEASHSWGSDLGLPLHLASEREWRDMFEAAGFSSIEQRRVRAPADGVPATWEEIEGSLLTVGVR